MNTIRYPVTLTGFNRIYHAGSDGVEFVIRGLWKGDHQVRISTEIVKSDREKAGRKVQFLMRVVFKHGATKERIVQVTDECCSAPIPGKHFIQYVNAIVKDLRVDVVYLTTTRKIVELFLENPPRKPVFCSQEDFFEFFSKKVELEICRQFDLKQKDINISEIKKEYIEFIRRLFFNLEICSKEMKIPKKKNALEKFDKAAQIKLADLKKDFEMYKADLEFTKMEEIEKKIGLVQDSPQELYYQLFCREAGVASKRRAAFIIKNDERRLKIASEEVATLLKSVEQSQILIKWIHDPVKVDQMGEFDQYFLKNIKFEASLLNEHWAIATDKYFEFALQMGKRMSICCKTNEVPKKKGALEVFKRNYEVHLQELQEYSNRMQTLNADGKGEFCELFRARKLLNKASPCIPKQFFDQLFEKKAGLRGLRRAAFLSKNTNGSPAFSPHFCYQFISSLSGLKREKERLKRKLGIDS